MIERDGRRYEYPTRIKWQLGELALISINKKLNLRSNSGLITRFNRMEGIKVD